MPGLTSGDRIEKLADGPEHMTGMVAHANSDAAEVPKLRSPYKRRPLKTGTIQSDALPCLCIALAGVVHVFL